MGAHSTIHITRSAAREYILKSVVNANDEKLQEILDVLLFQRLYNSLIVNDNDDDNEDFILEG